MTYTTLSDLLKGICDAIRAKKGTTGSIKHQDIPSEIESIESEPVLQDKTIVPTKSEQTVVADENYDGLRMVTVSGVPVSEKSVYADPVSNYTYYAKDGEFWNKIVVNKYNTFYERESFFNHKLLSASQLLIDDNTVYDVTYSKAREWLDKKFVLILVPGIGGGIRLHWEDVSTNNPGIAYLIAKCELDTTSSNEVWNVTYMHCESCDQRAGFGGTYNIGTIRIVNTKDYGINENNTQKYGILFELNDEAVAKMGFYMDADIYHTYDTFFYIL